MNFCSNSFSSCPANQRYLKLIVDSLDIYNKPWLIVSHMWSQWLTGIWVTGVLLIQEWYLRLCDDWHLGHYCQCQYHGKLVVLINHEKQHYLAYMHASPGCFYALWWAAQSVAVTFCFHQLFMVSISGRPRYDTYLGIKSLNRAFREKFK